MNIKTFYSNGKLLISGEYTVLDGALSLAVPTKFGQSLKVETLNEPKVIWESLDEKDSVWFKTEIELNHLDIQESLPHDETSKRLNQILKAVNMLNPVFFKSKTGFKITTKLDFPRNWGLGTSSTLINNIAQWTYIDAYQLLENTFGGSGYDIACAQNNTPITYQLQESKPVVNTINFNPSFIENLYFIHLNKKQNSRDGIKHYHTNKQSSKSAISEISDITLKMINCNDLNSFESLIEQHENIIAKLTKQTPVKSLLFNDFKGAIKSLGAWGGDFILATSKESPVEYFKDKGYETIIPYHDMVL